MKLLPVALFLAATLASCLAVASADFLPKCVIAPAGTKNCSGVTGPSCSNETYILSQAKANNLSALVCLGNIQAPISVKIQLSLNLPFCPFCQCFLVPASEQRSCQVLKADASFTKKGCSDQAALQSYLVAGPVAKACQGGPFGVLWSQSSRTISARLSL